MDSLQVLQYIKRLPGVAGVFVADQSSRILASEVPPMFDDAALNGMATDGLNALETLRAEVPDFNELRIDFDLMTILIRDLDGPLLFVLIDDASEVSSVRIAGNVASKRYSGESESASVLDATSQHGGSRFSLGSSKKEKSEKLDKKKDSGGSIWG